MKVETDKKDIIEVTPFDGFNKIYNDELIGLFELNKKDSIADFTFIEKYKHNEKLARLIIDKLTSNSD